MSSGLIKIGDIYYFQKSLPVKLANHLGIKIFKKTLGLDSKSEAVKIANEINVVFATIFKEFKRPVNAYDDYTPEDMKTLLLTEFYKVIDKYHPRSLPVLFDRNLAPKTVYKIKTLVEEYITYIDEIKHLETNTITSNRSALNKFFHKWSSLCITDLDLAYTRQMLTELGDHSAPNTTKEYIVKVKTFFKWVSRHKDITIDPKIITLIDDFNAGLKAEKVRDALDGEQLRRFFGPKYAQWFKTPQTYFPVLLSYLCGLRVSEANNLTVDSVVFYKNRLLLQIKNGKTENAKRYVVIPEIAEWMGLRRYIDNYLKTDPRPGASLWRRTVTNRYLSTKVSEYLVSIGIKENSQDRRYTQHSLRHSFATKMIASSVDDRFAKKYMGHSGSSLMTSRYFIQNVEADDLLEHVDAKLSFDVELQDLQPFNLDGIIAENVAKIKELLATYDFADIDPDSQEYRMYLHYLKDFDALSRKQLVLSDFEHFDDLALQAFLDVIKTKLTAGAGKDGSSNGPQIEFSGATP